MSFSPQIIEHFSNPQNVGELDNPDATAFIGNPVCGDQIHLYAHIVDDQITKCTFLAYGCTASLATASILTSAICGLHLDAVALIDEAKVIELAGGFTPSQRHCATLGQDVLRSLVHNYRTGSNDGLSGSLQSCQ